MKRHGDADGETGEREVPVAQPVRSMLSLSLSIYIYIYIYLYLSISIYLYT